jgi:ribosomal protein L30E
MKQVMPSQVVKTIDALFSHAEKGVGSGQFGQLQASSHGPQLLAIVSLIEEIPPELLSFSAEDYAELVHAVSAIKSHLAMWTSQAGNQKFVPAVGGRDAVTVIRRVLAICPDEYPPPSTTTLLFITDDALRESIRNDVGAATRALQNSEWKAATVLSGATIEALLFWRLQREADDTIEQARNTLAGKGTISSAREKDLAKLDLHNYIEVAAQLQHIKADTASAARLAKNFRNLIHPGKAQRLGQVCDRATAYSAMAALEHVIRDLGG